MHKNKEMLSEDVILEILQSAKDNFDGDIRKAIAGHLYGVSVVVRCGGVPSWACNYEIGRLKRQITIWNKS